MNRARMLQRLEEKDQRWDVIVVGGGATGAGVAVEAASRGYRTLLLEQHDFAKGTSSRSTKLVHGGVRYLAQGNISLVLEALKERGILLKNAPHLVHDLAFIVPNYEWWQGPFYGIGLKLYDMLAGKAGFGPSRRLSREETIDRIPNIERKDLTGGVIYYDGQFDDARLVINLLQTAVEQGATAINYMPVTGLLKSEEDIVQGVVARDLETNKEYRVTARVVINATGPFSDALRKMDDPQSPEIIQPSQGVHIVLDKSFLAGDSAIMVPHTDDGRVLFAIPWYDHVLVGTTDTPIPKSELEPRPRQEEVDFLLRHAARYLTSDPQPQDIKSIFVGIRPLVSIQHEQNTAAISREHTVTISRCGLVTIAGGKWTTYRKMAEDTVDQAAVLADLEPRPSVSEHLNIHGFHEQARQFGDLYFYGSDALAIRELLNESEENRKPLHPDFAVYPAEVKWAVRNEMARTVEDFLARRRRILFLNARAALEMAPDVAQIMAQELNRDTDWVERQVAAFNRLAQHYLP